MDDGNGNQEERNDQQGTIPTTGGVTPTSDVDYARNEDDSSYGDDKPLIPP